MNNVGGFVLSKIVILDADMSSSRAMLAKLRRACGKPPGASPDVFEITLDGAPDGEYATNAVHTALTLYGVHKQGVGKSMHDGEVSFGAAIRRLVEQDNSNLSAVKRRFDTVITANTLDELAHHARALVKMLRGKEIGFNYASFSNDLHSFQFPDSADRVRLSWGQNFYQQKKPIKEGATANE